MTQWTGYWTNKFRSWLPEREVLVAHPWLRPIASRVVEPQLWRLQPEAVARGAALGTFWAFVLPVAQILVAVFHCVWWRAHIPAAVLMTLITNPFTIGFWLWLAYRVGASILGITALPEASDASGVMAWLTEFGWPTVLGMAVFAIGGAALSYLCVKLFWRLRDLITRRTH